MRQNRGMSGTIVVGVDGSEESRRALRWALGEARIRGARVVALRAWVYPALAAGGLIPATTDLVDQLAGGERKELAETVAEFDTTGVDVEQVVVEEIGRASCRERV